MSIVTRTGDKGTTALMYGRRVSKSDPRVDACGDVDELNAALGMARAWTTEQRTGDRLFRIQKDLVLLMGELATIPADLERYAKDGFTRVSPGMTKEVEDWIRELENAGISGNGWATPGGTPCAAALDLARTICRRAERKVCALAEASAENVQPEIIVYLNRLSDLCWLLARWTEQEQSGSSHSLKRA